jgi:hypothetical protein
MTPTPTTAPSKWTPRLPSSAVQCAGRGAAARAHAAWSRDGAGGGQAALDQRTICQERFGGEAEEGGGHRHHTSRGARVRNIQRLCCNGHARIVEVLLGCPDADVNKAMTSNGATPLNIARLYRHAVLLGGDRLAAAAAAEYSGAVQLHRDAGSVVATRHRRRRPRRAQLSSAYFSVSTRLSPTSGCAAAAFTLSCKWLKLLALPQIGFCNAGV